MSIRILIVEDEPAIARNLSQLLVMKGYKVVDIAFDQQEAMEFIASQTIDLALLDINLGGQMEGIEIGRHLNEQLKIPFIFITSYTDEKTIQAAKMTRPQGYIIKPFDENEVYAAIEIAWYNTQNKSKQVINPALLNSQIIDPLTRKEFAILQELIEGKPYAQISREHYISINTVNSHVKKIYAKLGVSSKVEALQFCIGLK